MTRFDREATALLPDLVAVRRELHAAPEVGLDLPRTQATILRELEGLGLEVTTGTALTSVTAVLRGAHDGPTVLLRGDMDALPITEDTGLPFASPNGAMHACGHDLHVAGLIGAARLLAAHRDELHGSVVFMFQPGEEGYAGGKLMIEEGVLEAAGDRPVAAYAMHVDCTTPRGELVTRERAMMASVSALHLTVHGTGGHAARPHDGVDPVPVAAELILAIQTFAARRIPASDPAVLSVTKLRGDSEAGNVLSASVELELNIRTLSPTALDIVRAELAGFLTRIAEAHGCTVESTFIDSYPVTYNDPTETRRVLDVLASRGETVSILPEPAMTSEDFAYVLEEIPGTLVFLGVAASDDPAPMHSEHAVFGDDLLGTQAAILADLAASRLAN